MIERGYCPDTPSFYPEIKFDDLIETWQADFIRSSGQMYPHKGGRNDRNLLRSAMLTRPLATTEPFTNCRYPSSGSFPEIVSVGRVSEIRDHWTFCPSRHRGDLRESRSAPGAYHP